MIQTNDFAHQAMLLCHCRPCGMAFGKEVYRCRRK